MGTVNAPLSIPDSHRHCPRLPAHRQCCRRHPAVRPAGSPVCHQPATLPHAQGMDYHSSPSTLAHVWRLAARQCDVLDLGAAGIGRVLPHHLRPD